MREHESLLCDSEQAMPNDLDAQGDLQEVLASLQKLITATSHPIVRACLESAYDDIMHLTAYGDEVKAKGSESVAAWLAVSSEPECIRPICEHLSMMSLNNWIFTCGVIIDYPFDAYSQGRTSISPTAGIESR
jgi:hypothetical protein